MSEESNAVQVSAAGESVQSPPAAPVKAHVDDGPRVRLVQLAEALSRGLNRELMAEYLQLRRICR